MPLLAGHCTVCRTRLWRTVTHPKTGDPVPLWPGADAHFAIVRTALGQLVPGVAYCAAHAPTVHDEGPEDITVSGDPVGPTTVVVVQTAVQRHPECFRPRYGAWLEAWLRELATDHRLAASEFDPVLAQWREDVIGTEASIHGQT